MKAIGTLQFSDRSVLVRPSGASGDGGTGAGNGTAGGGGAAALIAVPLRGSDLFAPHEVGTLADYICPLKGVNFSACICRPR